jgi:asparagine synthase (glutamine-hydrolysing)
VLHAFIEWGLGCLGRFIGMFAFAIHDGETGTVTLARDQYGIKPLY